jgi:hypothetical protein
MVSGQSLHREPCGFSQGMAGHGHGEEMGGSLRLSFGWASIDLPPCLPLLSLSPPSLSSSPVSSVLYGVTCVYHIHPGRFRAKHWPPVLRSLACPRRQPANPEALRAVIDMSILLQGCPCCCGLSRVTLKIIYYLQVHRTILYRTCIHGPWVSLCYHKYNAPSDLPERKRLPGLPLLALLHPRRRV